MMEKQPVSGPDAAARRAALHQTILSLTFAAAIFVAVYALRDTDAPILRWMLVGVPATVLIVWMWVIFQSVRQADEMMQAMFLRAFAISGLIVLTAASAWGLFVEMLGAPDFPAFLLLPAFSVIYGVALMAQRAGWGMGRGTRG